MTERDFKGVWIPAGIWNDSRLSLIEKYYMAVYLHCDRIASEADLMMEQIASKSTICSSRKKLVELGLVSVITDPEHAKKVVLHRKNQGQPCQWCGVRTFALQDHHYPIPRSKGGIETVRICPNCHYEYHLLIGNEVIE